MPTPAFVLHNQLPAANPSFRLMQEMLRTPVALDRQWRVACVCTKDKVSVGLARVRKEGGERELIGGIKGWHVVLVASVLPQTAAHPAGPASNMSLIPDFLHQNQPSPLFCNLLPFPLCSPLHVYCTTHEGQRCSCGQELQEGALTTACLDRSALPALLPVLWRAKRRLDALGIG